MLLFCIGVEGTANDKATQSPASMRYPIPPQTEKLMFYIQRSMNSNTIAYELNLDQNKQLEQDAPIHPYWIRYEEDGNNKELSYIETKLAYGVESQKVNEQDDVFRLNLVSYPLALELRRSKIDGKYQVFVTVNNSEMKLDRIFFKTEGGSFFSPNIKYVDIFGINLRTGKSIVERIIP